MSIVAKCPFRTINGVVGDTGSYRGTKKRLNFLGFWISGKCCVLEDKRGRFIERGRGEEIADERGGDCGPTLNSKKGGKDVKGEGMGGALKREIRHRPQNMNREMTASYRKDKGGTSWFKKGLLLNGGNHEKLKTKNKREGESWAAFS